MRQPGIRLESTAALLALLPVAIIAAALVSCSDGIPEDWATYTNEEFGFSLRHPEDWNLKDKSSTVLSPAIRILAEISYSPTGDPEFEDDGSIFVAIQLRPDCQDTDLGDWFRLEWECTDEKREELAQLVNDTITDSSSGNEPCEAKDVLSTVSELKVSGEHAILQHQRFQEHSCLDWPITKSEFHVMNRGNIISILGFAVRGPGSEESLDVFERIVKSIKFNDDGASRGTESIDLRDYLTSDGKGLYARGKRVTDGDLAQLSDPVFSNVEKLDLIGTRVTDKGLIHIRALPLKFLKLNGTRVTDEGLAKLSGLPLRYLLLKGTKITDAGLVHLKGLPLITLDIRYTDVTAAGLTHLRDLPLKDLFLSRTRIGEEGIERLEAASPNLKIYD